MVSYLEYSDFARMTVSNEARRDGFEEMWYGAVSMLSGYRVSCLLLFVLQYFPVIFFFKCNASPLRGHFVKYVKKKITHTLTLCIISTLFGTLF